MTAPQPAPFVHTELLPIGPDTTEYRLVSRDGVDTFSTPHGEFLRVDPAAITLLTSCAIPRRVRTTASSLSTY